MTELISKNAAIKVCEDNLLRTVSGVQDWNEAIRMCAEAIRSLPAAMRASAPVANKEAFEKWCASNNLNTWQDGGIYTFANTQIAWEACQFFSRSSAPGGELTGEELEKAFYSGGDLGGVGSLSRRDLIGMRAIIAADRASRPAEVAAGQAPTVSEMETVRKAPASLDLYNELLYAVGKKYPGETRHQTALRYILQAETSKDNRACSALATASAVAGKGEAG